MDDIIGKLRQIGQQRSKEYSDDFFLIRGVWRIDHQYRPNALERELLYSMFLVQTILQGCCYCDYASIDIDPGLLYKDAREVITRDITTEIAILDAIFSVFEKSPVDSYEFTGTSDEKAVRRAQIVVDEVLKELGNQGSTVLNVGMMGNFVSQLIDRGVKVIITDFNPILISRKFCGIEVQSGERTLELIKNCDLVLATGMTLYSQTLADILDTVRRYGKKLSLFAATGSNFGEEYCRTFGIDLVISEPQPQYIFQGKSTIHIFRRKAESRS